MSWPAALDAQHTVTHEVEIVVRLLLAAAVGAAIGIEREMKDRPAGLRTHMLTALASAVFTILTFEIYHASKSTSDPIRIVEAVTAGVAFSPPEPSSRGGRECAALPPEPACGWPAHSGWPAARATTSLALIATTLTVLILAALTRMEGWLADDGKVVSASEQQKQQLPQR